MSFEVKGLSTAAYTVPDLDAGKEWYAKAFGVHPYFDEPFYVGFNINGFELGLMPEEGERTVGNSTISYWAVDDVQAAFDHFIDSGAAEIEAPSDVGGGVIVATVADPWGNSIGIIFNPAFDK